MAVVSEKRYKAHRLIKEAVEDFEAAKSLDEEYEVKKKASRACEDAFHAYVETVDVVLLGHGKPVPRSHDERRGMLLDIGRDDLFLLYGAAKDVLHTEGYYEQHVLTPIQKDVITRIENVVEKEL